MSLFKVKQWWSNTTNTENNKDKQNFSCMKVDKFSSHNDSDCILLGEGNLLQLFKPSLGQDALLLETELSDIILQIETGKFIGLSGDREIIVLHSQSYVIYELHRKEGLTDAGEQNNMTAVIKHAFKRRAYNLTVGPFGSSKARDLICVQSLDGTFSFFDQDTFLFMCIFNDILIPGPVAYVMSSDMFVICKSTWALEIYSYQQLRESSELSLRQNKTNIPQWTYNAGEEISAVQVIRTSSNFSSIIALGERHLYCFQDNGLMKEVIRFDFTPICFHSYLIGWYYEPGARLLVMVASDDSKLYIYEGTKLLWACDLMIKAVFLCRCFINSLPGGVVTLTRDGISVNYLGTEPDLNPNINIINEIVSPVEVQRELESVEEALKLIISDDKEKVADVSYVEKTISIKTDMGKPIENYYEDNRYESDKNGLQLMKCPLIITLICKEPKLIQNLQVTYICSSPFIIYDNGKYIDDVNVTQIIKTDILMSNNYDVSNTNIKILFTIIDHTGKIIILNRSIMLPLKFYCSVGEINLENQIKLNIRVNEACLDLRNIFTDFTKEELSNFEDTVINITFKYKTTDKTVTLCANDQEYSIESDDFPEISPILDHFLNKLNDYYIQTNIGVRITLKPSKEFISQMIHRFLKSIETHSKERMKLKKIEDELDVLKRQFTAVQKRLLVQYGSLPPAHCDTLEFLMKDTHQRIINIVYEIIHNRNVVCRAGNTLTAIGRLIICVLRNTSTDMLKVVLIEEMLSLDLLHDDCQEWEEAISKVSSFVCNKLFKNSEKDKEKLAPVTEQDTLSHINLKRLLKQLKIILEKVFDEINQDSTQGNVRTEELVEII